MAIADRINEMYTHVGDVYDTITNVDLPKNKNIQNIPQTIKDSYLEIMNNGIGTIWNNWEKVTGEGTSLTLNNTYQAPMRNLLKGNTSQTGTPTPTSPIDVNVVSGDNEISVCGKNLFDKNSVITGKYYTSEGTTTNATNSYCELLDIIENETYSIKIENKYSSTVRLNIFIYDTNMSMLSYMRWGHNLESNQSYTNENYTMPVGAKFISISVIDMSPTTENIDKVSIMFNYGSSASTYEPYQGNTYNIDLPVENLWGGFSNSFTKTHNGVQFTSNKDGTITAIGTTSTDYATSIVLFEATSNGIYKALPKGTYTVSGGGEKYSVEIYNKDTATRLAWINYTESSTSFTINETVNIVLRIQVIPNVTINETVKLMLCEGSKANTYTPYGITPIELCKIGNYQDYFAKSDGTQLFDKDNANKLDCLLNGQNGSIANYSGAKLLYIPCESSTTYTISKIKSARFVVGTSSSTPSNGVSCSVYQANNDATSITITSGTSDKYLAIFYYLSSADTLTEQQILDSIMINEGSSATPWQPYGVGKWYLHKEIGKVVLNGSELWQIHGSIASWFYCDILDNVRYAISENLGISNYYSYKPYYPNATTLVNGEFTIGYGANNIGRVVMKNTDYTTVNDFRTWLSSNNVSVYYILATSTNTEITDTTLINQLEELYIAKSKENQTNISQINNDLGFIISASALKKG